MRSTFAFAVLVTALVLLFSAAHRGDSAPVDVPPAKPVFLIRFGLDAKEGVDWSGSISGPQVRLRGWQFNAADSIRGNGWKCATERQNYWDTPNEARMRPTSNRVKVTGKGVLIENEGAASRDLRVSTTQGDFTFNTDLQPGSAPALFLDGRLSVSAIPATTVLTAGPDAEDYPSMVEAKDGTLWVAYQ